jgi:hypothetical protein
MDRSQIMQGLGDHINDLSFKSNEKHWKVLSLEGCDQIHVCKRFLWREWVAWGKSRPRETTLEARMGVQATEDGSLAMTVAGKVGKLIDLRNI